MADASSSLSTLPVIPLVNIFSFLGTKDLARCCKVSSRFNYVACGLPSWKRWCNVVWLREECCPGKTWKQLYAECHNNWGKYESCYAAIKKAWNNIEEFTKVHCPEIFASLNDGLSEEEINEVELAKLNGKVNSVHPHGGVGGLF